MRVDRTACSTSSPLFASVQTDSLKTVRSDLSFPRETQGHGVAAGLIDHDQRAYLALVSSNNSRIALVRAYSI